MHWVCRYQTVKSLIQQYMFVPAKHKDCYLTYICNELAGHSAIIFAATCATAQRLALMLRSLGFPAIPLHGQLSQAKRLASLNRFKVCMLLWLLVRLLHTLLERIRPHASMASSC